MVGSRYWVLLAAICLAAPAIPGASLFAAPLDAEPKAKSADLDAALLKDLDNELLEGAGDLNAPRKKPAVESAPDDAKPQLPEGEDLGQAGDDGDPLVEISRQMRSVERLLQRPQHDEHTDQLQKNIVDELAKLIDEAQRRAAQSSSSTKKKSRQRSQREEVRQPSSAAAPRPGKPSGDPARDSSDRLGKAEDARPDPQLLQQLMKDVWGHLPQRVREQMMQNSPERFVPQYELLIERYYQRLAEEQNSR